MGLLNDADQQQKLINTVLRHQAKIRFVLLVGGVAALLALPLTDFTKNISIHENSLAVGSAESKATKEDRDRLVKFIMDADKSIHRQGIVRQRSIPSTDEMKQKMPESPKDWAIRELKSLGLEHFEQHYSVIDPITLTHNNYTNLYAIYRATKSDSSESLLLHAQFRPSPTIGLAMAMMAMVSSQQLWSKNIILLITPDVVLGVEAFLQEYNQAHMSSNIKSGSLKARAGDIHSAISLSFKKARFTNLVIRSIGINGQKPNLDALQTAIFTAKGENIPMKIGGCDDQPKTEINPLRRKLGKYRCALTEVSQAFTCMADGAHGIMLRHGIAAISISSSETQGKRKIQDDAITLVELTLRSFNNMSQKFNQCYYFYFFIDCLSLKFVPLSLYIGPVLCILGSMLIGAVCLGLDDSLPKSETKQKNKTAENKEHNPTAANNNNINTDDYNNDNTNNNDNNSADNESESRSKSNSKPNSKSKSKSKPKSKPKSNSKSNAKTEEGEKTKTLDDEIDEIKTHVEEVETTLKKLGSHHYTPWNSDRRSVMPTLFLVVPAYALAFAVVANLQSAINYGYDVVVPTVKNECKYEHNDMPGFICALRPQETAAITGFSLAFFGYLLLFLMYAQMLKFWGPALDWRLIKSATYLCNTLCLATVAALNAPLAVGVFLIVLPLSLSISPTAFRFNIVSVGIAIMLSPPMMIYVYSEIAETSLASILVTSHVKNVLLGLWQLPLFAIVVLPTHAICVSSIF